jgi:hypothetical protein
MEVREQENEDAAEPTPAKEQSFFKQLILWYNPFIKLNPKTDFLQYCKLF